MKDPFEAVQTINFLDIGCSGQIDAKWSSLFCLLSYIGFDPNSEECVRLNKKTHPYQTTQYLPFAISGEAGAQTLYKTKSIYCYSLLRPNSKWLNRFAFGNLFKEVGTEPVQCTTLDILAQEQNLKADIIKIDTQGVELPILKQGGLLLENTFCIEAETAFVEDYVGETTYSQLDEFLRAKGFIMMDLEIHRASRDNPLALHGKHQPIWCQSLWLYDFIGNSKPVAQEQALKYLKICQALDFFDYGCELARYFHQIGVLEAESLRYLEDPKNWIQGKLLLSKFGHHLLGWLPEKVSRRSLQKLQHLALYGHTC